MELMEKIFNKKSRSNAYIFLLLAKCIYFLQNINYSLLSKCNNTENPLLKYGQCVSSCTNNEINEKICQIDNEIVKIQWLNNFIYFKYPSYTYINIATSFENNNLYFMASEFPKSNYRLHYNLNNEGYGLQDPYNPLHIIEINDTETKGRFNSEIFLIKLYESDNNNEYLINIGIADKNLEIYDFNEGKIYFDRMPTIFGLLNNIFTVIGVHLKLNSASIENKNTYLIGILACEYPSGIQEPHFYLKKVNFTSLDIQKIPPLYDSKDVKCSYSKIISCYETSYFFIVCFYQNENYNYTIIVYDYNLNEMVRQTTENGNSDEGYENVFFKCIHFFNEIGVFAYFDNNKILTFEFKIYYNNNNTIDNYYSNFNKFTFENYNFNFDRVTSCDMIKIKDKNFYFVGISNDKDILVIFSICNYNEDKFSIRIYTINTKNLYNYSFVGDIRIILYKNFLAICSNSNIYTSLILFSYPNTSDNYLDIYNYLYYHNNIKIYNLTLELEENQNIIDNNIFGYIYSGNLIVENCLNRENIYLADLNNKIIANNYFLKRDERIKLLIQKQEYYSSFCCTFKYAMVVSEPEFSEFNKYPKEYYDSGKTDLEEIYFENQNYIGKFNYYNICLNHSLTEIGCQNNCDLCEEMNPKICITCNNTYLYENNYKICQDKTIDNDSLYSMEININQSVKINSSNNEDGNDEHCNLKEIIKNNCFEDITSEMGREVYSYIKSNLINNNYTLIKTGNMIFQVSSFKIRANLGDISYIDLGECENLLKREYNISESEDLIIFQIDIKDLEKIKTYVQYEIYEPHEYHKLNLDICEDLTINIYSPVYLDNETALIYSSLNKEGYNLFNANDPFYNDICSPYTTLNGTDIILEDRKNDIYNKYGNISICQNNCIYEY